MRQAASPQSSPSTQGRRRPFRPVPLYLPSKQWSGRSENRQSALPILRQEKDGSGASGMCIRPTDAPAISHLLRQNCTHSPWRSYEFQLCRPLRSNVRPVVQKILLCASNRVCSLCNTKEDGRAYQGAPAAFYSFPARSGIVNDLWLAD